MKMSHLRRVILKTSVAAAAGAIAMLPLAALAQDAAFPSRPLRIVVPLPAGATTDVGARVLARELGLLTGQPVTVDNRPGGNNFIGVQVALNAPADGHTLFLGTNASMAANMTMLKKPGYDALADFTPVGMTISSRWLLVVGAASPFLTVEQLVAAARKEPLSVSAAASSTGFQMAAALFARAANLKLNVIPYKGSPPALQDVIGGQTDAMVVDIAIAMPLIASGKLRALAAIGDERLASVPEVPTLRERGFGSTALHSWGALFVAAKTPPAVVQRLARLVEQAMQTDSYRKFVAEARSEAVFMGPAPLAAFQKAQIEAYRDAMAAAGVLPE